MAIDLQIENISKSFGDLELFSDISFTVEERQRIGLVARNGKGKSTLLKIIAGEEPLDSGKITIRNGVRMGYLEQEPEFLSGLTVIEACLQRSGKADIISRYEKALEAGTDDLQHLMEEMDRLDAWDYENRVKQVLSKLKINDFNQPVKELSGGQKKRVALAAVLIEQPDLMILDEPTASLDAIAEKEVFDRFSELAKDKLTIFVSHRLSSATVANTFVAIPITLRCLTVKSLTRSASAPTTELTQNARSTLSRRVLTCFLKSRCRLPWMRRLPSAALKRKAASCFRSASSPVSIPT